MVNYYFHHCFLYGLAIVLAITGCNEPNRGLISHQLVMTGQAGVKKRTDTIITDSSHFISIYLTFDDGPLPGSETVNSIAASDSIKINVFIIGKFVSRDDTSMKRFISYRNNPFIEIGNHSFTHANSHYYHLYYKDPARVFEDFLVNNDSLHLVNKIGRLPGRNCWRINGNSRYDLADAIQAADTLVHSGYRLFGWDIEWRCDSLGKVDETAVEIAGRINKMAIEANSFTPGNIVMLCHDPMFSDSYNVLQVKELINTLKMKGNYRFRFLSDYPHMH